MGNVEITTTCEVRLIKEAASDQDVVDAARVSTQGGHYVPSSNDRNAGLINFLMRDRHGSPFEHTTFTFFVSAPIFVFRELVRHRIGVSYNEESGRYKELEGRFYVPPPSRPLVQVGKPGAYTYVEGSVEQYAVMDSEMRRAYSMAYEAYERLLAAGVAREVARMVLPVGIYSSAYVTCNARSLMHFLGLRTQDPRSKYKTSPQWEIDKLVAQKMEDHFSVYMPLTYEAFNQHGRVAP